MFSTALSWAQLPQLQIHAMQPPGGMAGTTSEVAVTAGLELDGLTDLRFSHPGITAERVGDPLVLAQAADQKFAVTVAADVPPGRYEVRGVGTHGQSNPFIFIVSELPQIVEIEPNQTPQEATPVTVGSIFSGAAEESGDDYFKFDAKQGQRLLIECDATRVGSRLDAMVVLLDAEGNELARGRDRHTRGPTIDVTIPADGSYWIKVHDTMYTGSTAHFYRVRISNAPYIDSIFPPAGVPGSTGTYTLFGRNLPGGSAVEGQMIGGQPLEQLEVQITIPPLNYTTLPDDPSQRPFEASFDAMAYSLDSPRGRSNPVYLAYATAPVVLEVEPNNADTEAQVIELPSEVAGRFNRAGEPDADWYTFEAKKDDEYHIDVYAHRLGQAADPELIVQQMTKNEEGVETAKDLQQLDDPARPAKPRDDTGVIVFDFGLNAVTDDPSWRFKAPDDGTYRLLVRNLRGDSGGDGGLVYRLSIRRLQPDFRLIAMPNARASKAQSLLLRPSGIDVVRVFAIRRDGFDGPVDVMVDSLPPGVRCAGVTIMPSSDNCVLTLHADEDAGTWHGEIGVFGLAQVGDAVLTRPARYAQRSWMDARTARTATALPLSVVAGWRAPVTIDQPVRLLQFKHGKTEIPIVLNRRDGFGGKVILTADPIPNLVPTAPVFEGEKKEDTLALELSGDVAPGVYGLVVTAALEMPYPKVAAASSMAQFKQNFNQLAAGAAARVTLSEQAQTKLQEQLTQIDEQLKPVTEAQAQADAPLKAAQEAFTAAKTAADEAAAAAQKEPENEELKAAAAAAQETQAQAAATATTAAKAKADADKAVNELNEKRKPIGEAKGRADGAVGEAKALAAAYEEARAAIDKLSTEPALVKLANGGLTIPVGLIRFIHQPPVQLKLYPSAAKVEQGQAVEVPVRIRRLNGYADAFAVTVAKPEGVGGVELEGGELKFEANQTRGTLKITTTAEATVGAHTLTVKLTALGMELTRPLPLEVVAPPPPPEPETPAEEAKPEGEAASAEPATAEPTS